MDFYSKNTIQIVWGIILVLTGVGVFFRITHVLPKIEQIQQFSTSTSCLKFCFYFVGISLVGGGLKKIFKNLK